LTGNSRPIQVAPGSIARFSAPNYFGVVQSNTDIAGGVNGNVGTGLFANAAAPSGHTTFGYTTSILFGMLVPERYSQFMARARLSDACGRRFVDLGLGGNPRRGYADNTCHLLRSF
jgi:hypothetical protein